jgi:subtilisin family serine protease
MNKKVKVAVLDSGIDTKMYYRLFKDYVEEGYSLCNDKNILEEKNNGFEDFNGHGTACAVMIKKLAPDVTIVPIKILLNDGRGRIEWLIEALELVRYLDVQVVNMSISSDTTKLKSTLKPLLKSISSQGIICIASKSNNRRVSIPAEMKNVIGVTSSSTIYGNEYYYCKKNRIEIIASGAPELASYENKMSTFFKGNSKATAIITGIVADYISKYGPFRDKNDVIQYLINNSNKKLFFSKQDMECTRKDIEATVREVINKLIREGIINVVIKDETVLNFSDSRIEDFYKIIMELEKVFKCKILDKVTVYKCYFETINNLSKLVEVSM